MVTVLVGAAALSVNGLWVYAMFDRAGRTCRHQDTPNMMVAKKK